MSHGITVRSVFRGGLIVGSGSVTSAAAAALLNLVLARSLAAEGFGVYAFVIATAGVLASIAGLGIAPLVIRDMARRSEDATTPKAGILAAFVLVSAASLFVAVVVASPIGIRSLEALGGIPPRFVFALSALLVAMTVSELIAEVFRGLRSFTLASYLGLPLQRIVLLGLVVVWIALGPNALSPGVAVMLTVGASVSSMAVAAGFLVTRIRISKRDWISLPYLGRLAVGTAPLAVASILVFVVSKFPVWVFGWQDRFDDVGVFALAVALVALLSLVPVTVTRTLAPFIASGLEAADTAIEDVMRPAAGVATVLTALGAVVLVGATLVLGPSVFGPTFDGLALVVAILSLATIATSYSGAAGVVLNVSGNQRWSAISTLAELTFLGVIIIPVSGTISVAMTAAVMSVGVAGRRYLQWWIASRRVGLRTDADLAAVVRSAFRHAPRKGRLP